MPEGPRRVALTGGIATGKSYVRARLEAHGVPTIDADSLARAVVAPGTDGLKAVVQAFGADVLDATGALDRRKLGALVFTSADRRQRLEEIIHPAVRAAIDAWFKHLEPSTPFAVADIPLLYETRRDRDFETVVVTACAPETQVRRVMERDGLDESQARQRLAAQLPIEEKARRADVVIRTDGSFEETDRQIGELIARLEARPG